MQDILYFDGRCPLCRREIILLQRLQGGGLGFVDIHEANEATLGKTKQELLQVLHLQVDGEWVTGVDATVRAWSHTAFGVVFRPLRWPLLRPLVDLFYRRWAERRYQRLYACQRCGEL